MFDVKVHTIPNFNIIVKIGSTGHAPDRKITSKIVDNVYATHDL
jgi:hypothetical protein